MKLGYKYIYGLFSASGNECLYVGCTNDPATRYLNHLRNKTTGKEPFVFTILFRTPAKYGARDEARTIKKYKDMGQAKFNVSLCSCSLNRTIDESEAIKMLQEIKHGGVVIATDSDARALTMAAGVMRRLEIKDIRFDKEKDGENFRLTAVVNSSPLIHPSTSP